MMTKTLSCRTLLAGACLALAAGAAQAQANTGSLAGWSAYGDASAALGAITLTTAFLDGASDQAGNVSGTSAAGYLALSGALGLAADGLDLPEQEATEGSMVTQTFNMLAGEILVFNWTFTSTEALYSDRAFVAFNGQVFTLATSQSPGGPNSLMVHFPQVSGPLTLGIGVIDTYDFNGVSNLTISNLQVISVPEPASVALLLAGLGIVGGAARARRKAVA